VTTSVAFLLAAVVLSVVGCAIFLLRQRKPTSIEHGIDSFSREMQALAPDPSAVVRARPAAPPEPPPGGDAQHGG
jgi:hypothetical protein